MPPVSSPPGPFDWRQIISGVVTAVALAAIFGAWRFYDSTRTDIAVLRLELQTVQRDVDRVEAKVDDAIEIMRRARTEQGP